MSIRILFLGPLGDLAPESEMQVDAPLDWKGLLGLCPADLAEALAEERVNVACRGKVLADKKQLLAQDGDEIALLPPVSGG